MPETSDFFHETFDFHYSVNKEENEYFRLGN